MVEILIIADDLTGAIDGASPFIGAGVEVWCDFDASLSFDRSTCRVVSINANTRHVPASQARQRVATLVNAACAAGVRMIVKKTDSVLRGNVGAELEGLLDAAGCSAVHFCPAFPRMQRTTLQGIHYVDGQPLAQTAFAKDPFEPVMSSNVCEIIAATSTVATTLVACTEQVPQGAHGIVVYDAVTDDDLDWRVSALCSTTEFVALAGCAGVLAALARVLHMPAASAQPHSNGLPTLAFCGSVNPVSVAQCAQACAEGATVHFLPAAHILNTSFPGSSVCRELAKAVDHELGYVPLVVVDASVRATEQDRMAAGLSPQTDERALVSSNLGHIIAQLIHTTSVTNLLVMGGDVLLAVLQALETNSLQMVAELAPGVVVSCIKVGNRTLNVISKSGGFGEPNMFLQVAALLQGQDLNTLKHELNNAKARREEHA